MEKILIVDDEKKITEVLSAYLMKEGYSTFTAFDGMMALKILYEENPDLIILDLMLPDMMGEELCIRIRSQSDIPVIMLTAKVNEDHMINGLKIGADDYIVKPFSPRNVLARVETVLRRNRDKAGVKRDVVTIGAGYIIADFDSHNILKEGIEIHLTPSEYLIFKILVKSPNRVFTREQIISYALNGEYAGYDRSIDTHIKRIRQKTEPDYSQPRYFITVHGMGYKFVP